METAGLREHKPFIIFSPNDLDPEGSDPKYNPLSKFGEDCSTWKSEHC